jgi:hypothetical protein
LAVAVLLVLAQQQDLAVVALMAALQVVQD